MSVFESKEFMEWFNALPSSVKPLVEQVPPDKDYRVDGGHFLANVLSYGEPEGDEEPTITAIIYTPFFQREVFGLKSSNFKSLAEDEFTIEMPTSGGVLIAKRSKCILCEDIIGREEVEAQQVVILCGQGGAYMSHSKHYYDDQRKPTPDYQVNLDKAMQYYVDCEKAIVESRGKKAN